MAAFREVNLWLKYLLHMFVLNELYGERLKKSVYICSLPDCNKYARFLL